MSNLKVVTTNEGGGATRGLLRSPTAPQEGIPDKDSFLQSGVKMKSDVAAV